VADAFGKWLTLRGRRVPDGSAAAKALDYSLNRWAALRGYLDDGDLPADNNWVENKIRPMAIGRNNWLCAGSLRAGKRAAAVMRSRAGRRVYHAERIGEAFHRTNRLPGAGVTGIEFAAFQAPIKPAPH
jgi:hypothetical protein